MMGSSVNGYHYLKVLLLSFCSRYINQKKHKVMISYLIMIHIGGSGLDTLGIGAIHLYRELVEGQNKGYAKFGFDTNSDPVKVTITGKAVFEDFEIREVPKKIEFVCNPGSCCTMLSKLTVSEIYLRIKSFYSDILDNCLGKTISEQQDYLFRFNEPNSMLPMASGFIEDSEEYIRNLPESSIDANHEDIVKQIIYGILEYAYHAKDESGVKMHQYANALMKKL